MVVFSKPHLVPPEVCAVHERESKELMHTALRTRMKLPGQKRLLALDGGGIRGLITIEILARLEEMLRLAKGADDFVLADYFDYVAGTSTGAIIATFIALGLSVDRIRAIYLAGGAVFFKRAPLFKQLYYRHVAEPMIATFREMFRDSAGHERTLGDDDLRTLLLVVMRNQDTDSPWPISNNPYAKYNQPEDPQCNLRFPLWQLIRASTAAPTYFPVQKIDVGSEAVRFADGGLTPYNNPAFMLFLMATLPQYCLGWEMGEEKMLLVSVGTGVRTGDRKKVSPRDKTLLHLARAVPLAMIDGTMNEQDLLCRVFGRCRFGSPIDGELGDLIDQEQHIGSGLSPFSPKKFTYVRYDPSITREGLAELGLGDIRAEDAQRMNSADHMPELMEIGRAYARQLELAHFGPFDPMVLA